MTSIGCWVKNSYLFLNELDFCKQLLARESCDGSKEAFLASQPNGSLFCPYKYVYFTTWRVGVVSESILTWLSWAPTTRLELPSFLPQPPNLSLRASSCQRAPLSFLSCTCESSRHLLGLFVPFSLFLPSPFLVLLTAVPTESSLPGIEFSLGIAGTCTTWTLVQFLIFTVAPGKPHVILYCVGSEVILHTIWNLWTFSLPRFTEDVNL